MNDNDNALHLCSHSQSMLTFFFNLTILVSLEITNSLLKFRRYCLIDEEMNLEQGECSCKDIKVVTRKAKTITHIPYPYPKPIRLSQLVTNAPNPAPNGDLSPFLLVRSALPI